MQKGPQTGISSSSGNPPDSAALGAAAAIGAFGFWALFPIYFNQFGPGVSPWEILLQRMIWAGIFLLGFVVLSGRLDRVRALIKRRRALLALAGSALAISTNWATFIYAVTRGEILQSSLGYFINPLFNVLLGYCFLGERLQPLQRLAVALAAVGVLLSLIAYGEVPWLALILAASFGLYGLIRKQVEIDSVTGLMMETMLLMPIAAGWLALMYLRGEAVFLHAGPRIDLLLIGAGLITLLPLVLFATAARRLRLTTLGLLQYIAPTGHFLIGVYLYGEPFTTADAITFGCIWAGLALYTADMWQTHRRQLALK
ncbi:MAG: EamA family transporter RarD [Desulfatitalea sp.]|nr:EamA family transporter RarD [Desulfatitalea sp.]